MLELTDNSSIVDADFNAVWVLAFDSSTGRMELSDSSLTPVTIEIGDNFTLSHKTVNGK